MHARRRLEVLADGTVRQESPITGTVVWTVPGRSQRPLLSPLPTPQPLAPARRDSTCAFCSQRYLETPPEKSRIVLGEGVGQVRSATPDPATPTPTGATRLDHVPASHLFDTVADFRRIPNLFEILPLSYWQANYDWPVPDEARERAAAYVAEPAGREHVLSVMRTRMRAAGASAEQVATEPEYALLERSIGLFAGGHDVIVSRRHFVDGAHADDQLCSSGDLTPDEHANLIAFTVDSAAALTQLNPYVRYVAVFQNWLRPAGASFDHLHKQLVAIDELGPLMERCQGLLHDQPDLFNVHVTDPAAREGLVIAENDHAIALAGVGHRYPTIEVLSTSTANRPWEHDAEALRGMSDLLHACHAATGHLVPSNEEWHYRPPGDSVPMPWRVMLKWRVSTLAGFEGGTKINVNTISPFVLRDRVVRELGALRSAGRIAAVRIGAECTPRVGALRYTEG